MCNREVIIIKGGLIREFILWATNAIGTKQMDFSKAVKDLKHDPRVMPEEGIMRTVEWLKSIYTSEPLEACLNIL